MLRRLGWAVALVGLVACTAGAGTPTAKPVETPRPPTTSTSEAPQPSADPSDDAPSTPTIALAHGAWVRAIDAAIAGRDVSVAVGTGRRIVYSYRASTPRVLASNEKLLTSMAALDLLGPAFRFRTRVATHGVAVEDGALDGDVWLIGGGDPSLTTARLGTLADKLRSLGVRRITGRVLADAASLDRGWWAPGWLRGISRDYVARPTALRLAGSSARSPEAEAASAFRAALLAAGITLDGTAGVGAAPARSTALASTLSAPLETLLVHQNHESDNLYAELTTKVLGATVGHVGSTAAGARVIGTWAAGRGVDANVRDGSGLSDLDRTSALGVLTLLLAAQRASWFPAFERSLPTGGTGTLAGRLIGVPVRAKTGTLFVRPASALSGYVTTQSGRTIAFSVLTHDLPEATAEAIEDAVVRALAEASVAARWVLATGALRCNDVRVVHDAARPAPHRRGSA